MSGSSSPQPMFPPSLFNQYIIAFEGSSIACILFGVYLAVAGFNIVLLRQKKYNILLTYTVIQLSLTTSYFVFSLYGAPAQSLGIFGISSYDGPDALSPWPAIVVDVLFVLNTWASDAFLLYRCYAVCMGSASALAFPVLLYMATVGSSLAWLAFSSAPGAVYSTRAVQVAGVCYWSCSVAMTVCASSLIAARMMIHQRAIAKPLGARYAIPYLRYMSMTLESALLYTVFVIIALIVFMSNSPLENVFFPVLGTVQAIAPSLIIYRIARGIAFESERCGSATAGSLRFASIFREGGTVISVHQDIYVSDGSDTVQASLGSGMKPGRDTDSSSSVDGSKEEV